MVQPYLRVAVVLSALVSAGCAPSSTGGAQRPLASNQGQTTQGSGGDTLPDSSEFEGEGSKPGFDPATTPLLSPAELEQVVAAFGRCLAEATDRAFIRFRAEPLYGVSMEFGVFSDRTGQVSRQVEEHCLVETNLDALISKYQMEHPLRPEDHTLIVDLFTTCVAVSDELTQRLPQMATAEDVARAMGELFPQLAQSEGQLLLDCAEDALYGPGVDYVELRGP